jgi:hypothetical protein
MAASGAISLLPRTPAKGPSLNRERALGLGGGNRAVFAQLYHGAFPIAGLFSLRSTLSEAQARVVGTTAQLIRCLIVNEFTAYVGNRHGSRWGPPPVSPAELLRSPLCPAGIAARGASILGRYLTAETGVCVRPAP